MPLLPKYVVLIIGNYYVICSQFDNFNKGIVSVCNGYVSLQRMQNYLLEPEMKTPKIEKQTNETEENRFIRVENMNASFTKVYINSEFKR